MCAATGRRPRSSSPWSSAAEASLRPTDKNSSRGSKASSRPKLDAAAATPRCRSLRGTRGPLLKRRPERAGGLRSSVAFPTKRDSLCRRGHSRDPTHHERTSNAPTAGIEAPRRGPENLHLKPYSSPSAGSEGQPTQGGSDLPARTARLFWFAPVASEASGWRPAVDGMSLDM